MAPKKSSKKLLSAAQAKQVAKIAKSIDLRREEKKYHSTQGTAVSMQSVGSIIDLSVIAQGDGATSRDGDSLLIRSMQMRYDTTCADTSNITRVILFQWFDDTTPSDVDVLLTAGTHLVRSPYNHDQRQKFRVLYDRTHTQVLSGDSYVVSGSVKVNKFGRKSIRYDAAATTGSNKIWMLLCSDSGAASHPTINYDFKLNFSDS